MRHRREQTYELAVLGQFLFSALGSICREKNLAPALVGTPSDVRELIAYRSLPKDATHRETPALARGWRAGVVGDLFDDLLSGKMSVRISDPDSDHPLAFDRYEPGSE